MAVLHSTGCIILEVQLDRPPPWVPGPLPVEGSTAMIATAERRATYFAPRAAMALYGPMIASGSDPPIRVHTFETAGLEPNVLAAEFLSFPEWVLGATGLFIVHVDLGRDDPAAELTRWLPVDPQAPVMAAARHLLGAVPRLAPTTRRARTVSFVCFDEAVPDSYMVPGMTAEEGWRWAMATATPYSRFVPDINDPELFEGTVHLSQSWRALVLRDGVSFVGLVPGDPYLADAPQYVRSLYLDAYLLVLMQRTVLDDLANSLAAYDDRIANHDEVMRLWQRFIHFRNALWWRQITQTGPAQRILRAAQHQHGVDDLYDDLSTSLGEYARQLEAETDVRTNRALALLTVWGVPMAIALAAAPVAVEHPSVGALGIASVLGLLLGTILHFSVGRSFEPGGQRRSSSSPRS